MQLGEPVTIAEDMVRRLHDRYVNKYGQG
jgi:hypothetical protein